MVSKIDTLYNLPVLVVKREETLDPDDRASISYEIVFISNDAADAHTSFTIATDCKPVYDKFKVGMVTTLEFLENIPELKVANARSN